MGGAAHLYRGMANQYHNKINDAMRKTINICIPTVRCYDLLRELLLSLCDSTVDIDTVHIIDNGKNPGKEVFEAIKETIVTRFVVTVPQKPMGVAESWNWFIRNVPEERIIVNDDVKFSIDSLERMLVPGHFVTALAGTNAFSCFILRDSCVQKVGLFDEEISPGYAYFEDCDYNERMRDAGIFFTEINADVIHRGSQTLVRAEGAERVDHNRKFLTARNNFFKKWGFLPGARQ
jgi:hypothetical protein